MKKLVFFACKSVSCVIGIITPLLLLSCACRKFSQNNSILSDTIKVVITDSVYRTHIAKEQTKDSIYVHDSVFVANINDTIYIERWHTQYKYIYQGVKQLDTLHMRSTNVQEHKRDKSVETITTKSIRYKAIFTLLAFLLLAAGLWKLST